MNRKWEISRCTGRAVRNLSKGFRIWFKFGNWITVYFWNIIEKILAKNSHSFLNSIFSTFICWCQTVILFDYPFWSRSGAVRRELLEEVGYKKVTRDARSLCSDRTTSRICRKRVQWITRRLDGPVPVLFVRSGDQRGYRHDLMVYLAGNERLNLDVFTNCPTKI